MTLKPWREFHRNEKSSETLRVCNSCYLFEVYSYYNCFSSSYETKPSRKDNAMSVILQAQAGSFYSVKHFSRTNRFYVKSSHSKSENIHSKRLKRLKWESCVYIKWFKYILYYCYKYPHYLNCKLNLHLRYNTELNKTTRNISNFKNIINVYNIVSDSCIFSCFKKLSKAFRYLIYFFLVFVSENGWT